MTYLEMVNDVLIRLRESTVATVAQTDYSKLIGKFVNDAKRQVEDAYAWNILDKTETVTTVAATSSYTVPNSGIKFRAQEVFNTSAQITMRNIGASEMARYQNLTPVADGIPEAYVFDGVASGNAKVTVWPTPDGVYTLKFLMTVPQADLSAGADIVLVPDVLVVQQAYARALVERGEDGGIASNEAYMLYRVMLADYIALEASRFPEMMEWVPV